MELQDITFPVECDDGSMKPDAAVKKWSDTMLEATAAIHRFADSPKRYKQQMTDAGFINVHEVVYKWPTNPWPKDPKYKELGAYGACRAADRELTLRRCLVLREHRRQPVRPQHGPIHARPRLGRHRCRTFPHRGPQEHAR